MPNVIIPAGLKARGNLVVSSSGSTGGGSGGGTAVSSPTQTNRPSGKKPLPKAATTDVTFQIASMIGTLRDVGMALHVLHGNLADLEVRLLAPDATSVMLFNRKSGGEHLGSASNPLVCDQEATATIATGTAPYPGPHQPHQGDLLTLKGKDPNGTWTLRIVNHSASLDGSLELGGLLLASGLAEAGGGGGSTKLRVGGGGISFG